MIDIVLVTAPITFTDQPLASIAMLGGALKSHGINYRFIDINAEINLDLGLHEAIVEFCKDHQKVIDADAIAAHIKSTAERILSFGSRWVGISLFCFQGQNYTKLLCQELKLQSRSIKIVLGGPGIITDGLNGTDNIAAKMIDAGIADCYLRGEGEHSLPALLLGKANQSVQITDLDALSFADYDEYDLSLYQNKSLTLVGSRGCVRACTFCDIHSHWPRFVFRSGKHIVDEMIYNSQRHGIYKFTFGDSLVNGSMLAYRDMTARLAEYNLQCDQDHKISWESQFICRPKHQMTEQDWLNTKDSGAAVLYIGVESMIDHIRLHMGKKFTNEDLFYTLDKCLELGIKTKLLMIVGYPTETEQDHKDELKLYQELVRYKSILKVSIGTTLSILPGTPLAGMIDELGITTGSHEQDWKHSSSNLEIRLRRRTERLSALEDLGISKEWMNELWHSA